MATRLTFSLRVPVLPRVEVHQLLPLLLAGLLLDSLLIGRLAVGAGLGALASPGDLHPPLLILLLLLRLLLLLLCFLEEERKKGSDWTDVGRSVNRCELLSCNNL